MEDFQAERIAVSEKDFEFCRRVTGSNIHQTQSVIGCLHDWRDELVSRPLDSVEVGVGVLLDLGSDSDTNRIDWKIRVINLLKRSSYAYSIHFAFRG